MLYVSTRGKTDMVSSAHAISSGLAKDGGLFVPRDFPPVALAEIDAMKGKPYGDRAVQILSRYLTDFSEEELRECVSAAYSKEKFGGFAAPLHLLKKDTDILELWHGPTSAPDPASFPYESRPQDGRTKKERDSRCDKRRYGKSGYGRIQ